MMLRTACWKAELIKILMILLKSWYRLRNKIVHSLICPCGVRFRVKLLVVKGENT